MFLVSVVPERERMLCLVLCKQCTVKKGYNVQITPWTVYTAEGPMSTPQITSSKAIQGFYMINVKVYKKRKKRWKINATVLLESFWSYKR